MSRPQISTNLWFRQTGDYRDFWLVQRVTARKIPAPDHAHLDANFTFDYMGAAEFEGDMASLSLRYMRANGLAVVQSVPVTHNNTTRPVYFVGPRKIVDGAVGSFDEWFNRQACASKENARFAGAFSPIPGTGLSTGKAWWAYRAGVMFALDRDVADLLAAGVNFGRAGRVPWWKFGRKAA